MKIDINQKPLNITEAAEYLSIKVSKLRSMIFQKKITYIKAGRAIRFFKNDLENYLIKNRVEAIEK